MEGPRDECLPQNPLMISVVWRTTDFKYCCFHILVSVVWRDGGTQPNVVVKRVDGRGGRIGAKLCALHGSLG